MKATRILGKCFTVNFGTKKEINDFPILTMSLKNNSRYDNGIITTPTDNCFLVLVGGKYVKIIEDVVKEVEKIIKNIGISPLAMLIQSKSRKIYTGTFPKYPIVSIICYFKLNNFHFTFNKTFKVFNHFKVVLNSRRERGLGFRLQCPGVYQMVPYKMMIFYNGTVSKGATYKDICSEHRTARLAYGNDYPKSFLVDTKTNTMVQLKKIDKGSSSIKGMVWEIYKSFFENNEIRPSFIYANYTYDVVNEDTGKKIGSFGTVSEVFHKSLCLLSLVF